jgi:hypothetical protein
MTALRARALASLAAIAVAASCTHSYEIPIETPIRAKLDVGAFQRVLVAGFISGGSEDVDGNLETTRLLRSQLRTKSVLNVIDSDVLPLIDVATGDAPAPVEIEPQLIREEADLEEFQHVFANVEYWKRIGEEYQQPLIVTGTVMFTPLQTTQLVQREREVYDSFGRRSVVAQRTFQERRGFSLDGRFIFIDGRDGTTLHSETFGEQILYSANQTTPALSSYFELMDRLIPSFLSTLSSQRIRGTRVLLN